MIIQTILDEHKATIYKLCKESGISIGQHNKISKAIAGEKAISFETLTKLLAGLSKIAGREVKVSEMQFDPTEIKLK